MKKKLLTGNAPMNSYTAGQLKFAMVITSSLIACALLAGLTVSCSAKDKESKKVMWQNDLNTYRLCDGYHLIEGGISYGIETATLRNGEQRESLVVTLDGSDGNYKITLDLNTLDAAHFIRMTSEGCTRAWIIVNNNSDDLYSADLVFIKLY